VPRVEGCRDRRTGTTRWPNCGPGGPPGGPWCQSPTVLRSGTWRGGFQGLAALVVRCGCTDDAALRPCAVAEVSALRGGVSGSRARAGPWHLGLWRRECRWPLVVDFAGVRLGPLRVSPAEAPGASLVVATGPGLCVAQRVSIVPLGGVAGLVRSGYPHDRGSFGVPARSTVCLSSALGGGGHWGARQKVPSAPVSTSATFNRVGPTPARSGCPPRSRACTIEGALPARGVSHVDRRARNRFGAGSGGVVLDGDFSEPAIWNGCLRASATGRVRSGYGIWWAFGAGLEFDAGAATGLSGRFTAGSLVAASTSAADEAGGCRGLRGLGWGPVGGLCLWGRGPTAGAG